MPFFSIIMPVFNQIYYLKKKINLFYNQNFRDFEILIIDDGSTDGSDKICDSLQEYFEKVKVTHQENLGVYSARNKGIEIAQGEYICFFDIDDEVPNNWLERIYRLINNIKPNVLIYSYKEINPQLNTETKFEFQNKYYISNNEIRNDYVKELSGIKFNNGFVWNKVYKRDFLTKNNIKFPDLRIQQDEVFNHKVYEHADSLMTSSEVLYDYYVYDTGNIRNTYIPDRLNIFEEVKHSFFTLADHWQLKSTDLEYYIHSRFVKNSLYNRNPKNLESGSIFRNKLFITNSLQESVRYMMEYSKGLSKIERLYLKGIINKSNFLFSIAETAHLSISKVNALYHKIIR